MNYQNIKIANVGLILFLLFLTNSFAQNVKGIVLDKDNNIIVGANIKVDGAIVAVSNDSGKFAFTVKADTAHQLSVSSLNYEMTSQYFTVPKGKILELRIDMSVNVLNEVKITDDRDRETGIQNLNAEVVSVIATPGDPTMTLIKSAGLGVATNNELSSGYSVRGGNFDENLIYVNDVEIYRPFLARSGQQEGLSFINADLVNGIKFGSGGFEAKYGDKMSSVLDITYRKPTKFRMSVMGSMLGANFQIEDAILKNNRLRYNIGVRYKSNNYILSGLDTKGDYQPNFFDAQGIIYFDITDKWEISVLGGYSDNNYLVIPQNRTTIFGHVQEAKQLNVYFDGKEVTRFQVGNVAGILQFKPNDKSSYKLITSYYSANESEKFDVEGQYFLGEIESDLSDPQFGEVVNTVGVGSFINHARNELKAQVFSTELKSRTEFTTKNTNFSTFANWGIRYQNEKIEDKLDEWNLSDSSGYLLPYYGVVDTGAINLPYVLKSKINLESNRFLAYYQQSFSFTTKTNHKITFTAGARAQYWDLNQEFLVSPRFQFSWKPGWEKTNMLFRVSGGIYYQAPFYRELRDFNGNINKNVKAQRSIHAIVGMDYQFKIWDRPFKFITEVYYKHLDNLNPYEIDNIRIRYYAQNNANGFATGIDMKLMGEFIQGLESWVTASIMGTYEDIQGDQYIDKTTGEVVFPGFIPRPTDQRVTFGIFFQDHIPKVPAIRVHLNLLLGSALPFGPPSTNRYSDTLRAPFYRRVDIGFSYVILQPDRKIKNPKSFFAKFNTLWVGLEIFNLFDINNTISYLWIKDISNRQYAVPNYLTPRLFNLKLLAKF